MQVLCYDVPLLFEFFARNNLILSLFVQGRIDTSPPGNNICRSCVHVPWFHPTNLHKVRYDLRTVVFSVHVCVCPCPREQQLSQYHCNCFLCRGKLQIMV